MATHSSILVWRIPWTEEPGGLQSVESQRVGHDWVTNTSGLEERLLQTVKLPCWDSAAWKGRGSLGRWEQTSVSHQEEGRDRPQSVPQHQQIGLCQQPCRLRGDLQAPEEAQFGRHLGGESWDPEQHVQFPGPWELRHEESVFQCCCICDEVSHSKKTWIQPGTLLAFSFLSLLVPLMFTSIFYCFLLL